MHSAPSSISFIIAELIDKATTFGTSFSTLPSTETDAIRKLKTHGLSDEEIQCRAGAFESNNNVCTTVVLANYELLHGITELDKAMNESEHYNCYAESIISIYRVAEVCLYNLAMLTNKIVTSVEDDEIGSASCDMRWCCYLHDTLHNLSQLIIEFDRGHAKGDSLDLHDSPAFQQYHESLTVLHRLMQTTWAESPEHIQNADLDDAQRYIFFNEYINVNYERIWLASLSHTRLPDVFAKAGEKQSGFFRRIVNTDSIQKAVELVELKDSTNLLQFRAYHQISEVFVRHINKWACRAVVKLVSEKEHGLAESVRILVLCNKLLGVVNDTVKPILRALSPKAYFTIRPALGVTSGSHSYNLRKGLFNTVYPLLLKTIRLKLVGFDPVLAKNDDVVYEFAKDVLISEPHGDLAETIRQVVYIHQHIRLWRDDHIQFIKSQIGISPEHEEPMASTSGAPDASNQAHQFRSTHQLDQIAPLYKAVLGRPMAPTHELVTKNGFDEFMARQTALAATKMYPDIQSRRRNR